MVAILRKNSDALYVLSFNGDIVAVVADTMLISLRIFINGAIVAVVSNNPHNVAIIHQW